MKTKRKSKRAVTKANGNTDEITTEGWGLILDHFLKQEGTSIIVSEEEVFGTLKKKGGQSSSQRKSQG